MSKVAQEPSPDHVLTEGSHVKQLLLFSSPKVLLERLGDGFFKAVPAAPGVYLFRSADDKVLYVGQSGNLRKRLNGYKNLPIESVPRRKRRLFHSVRSITWELCDTALAAQLRESVLLRLHRPKFNVVDTWPEGNSYTAMKARQTRIELRLTKNSKDQQPDERLYGAFKGTRPVRAALGALTRLFWLWSHPTLNRPMPLGFAEASERNNGCCLEMASDEQVPVWSERLHGYLSGSSPDLVAVLTDSVAKLKLSAFYAQLFQNDLELLATFYELGPNRNRILRERFELHSPIIDQTELGPLLIRARERAHGAIDKVNRMIATS